MIEVIEDLIYKPNDPKDKFVLVKKGYYPNDVDEALKRRGYERCASVEEFYMNEKAQEIEMLICTQCRDLASFIFRGMSLCVKHYERLKKEDD